MHRSLLTIVVLMLALVSTAQKRHFGNYFNKSRYWGPMFVLKPDSTFEYTERMNAGSVTTLQQTEYGEQATTTSNYIFEDSSYGTYRLVNDTVYLSYATEEIKGDHNGHNVRPIKLYWKGKNLYFVHPHTGAVLKEKEYYMKWSKWRAPNLLRADERYRTGQ